MAVKAEAESIHLTGYPSPPPFTATRTSGGRQSVLLDWSTGMAALQADPIAVSCHKKRRAL